MTVILDKNKSLQLLVDEKIAELGLGSYAMLNRLQKKVISQQLIKWNTNAQGATATGEATTVEISAFDKDDVVGASLPIGKNRLRHSFSLQKEDIAEAKAAGKGALSDLFGYQIESGMRVIMETLSGRLYTGTGVSSHGGIVGLQTAVAATGVYADVDPATYPEWSAFVNSAGSNRAMTSVLLNAMDVGIRRKGGNFTAIYMTPELASKYKELFAANLSIQNQLPAGVADLGYTGLAYMGRPIVQDIYCPANQVYFVNEPEVCLYTYAQNNTSNRSGMQFYIEQLPSTNPDAEKYVVAVKPQLQVHNRAKGAALLNAITQ